LAATAVASLASCSGTMPAGEAGAGGDTASGLPSPAVLQRWHEEKAALGPTWSGSAAWRRHVETVEEALAERGVLQLSRHPVRYARWWTGEDPDDDLWSLEIDGRRIPVASYWAYSGSTPDAGVTGPLVLHDQKK